MKPAADDLKPGTVLADSYTIVRPLARGGMGTVYEATHNRLASRRVAIKVLRADAHLSRREVLGRFRREAEICSALKHPHIVGVTDWGTLEDDSPFFVMELLDGQPLDQRLAAGHLSEPLIYRVLDQCAAALQYAHEQGIVHRDVKPSNLFLETLGRATDDHWHVKVLDFGISKVLSANTLETTEVKLLGSPRYMSPEQARGQNETLTPSADQWALATVAYEMLAGVPAFNGDTLSAVLFNIVHETPPPLAEMAPRVPATVVQAVNKAMAKDPADRFPAVVDFIAALGALHHDPADHQAETMVSGGRRPRLRRRPARAWLPAVALSLAGGLVATGILVRYAGRAAPDQPAPSLASPIPTPLAPTAPTSPSSPREADPTTPVSDDPLAMAPTPTPTDARHHSKTRQVNTPPPAEVVALLAEAEQLLSSRDYAGAARLATRTIGMADTPQARQLIAVAHCGRGDLEMTKASLHQVRAADRPTVIERCRALGLEL